MSPPSPVSGGGAGRSSSRRPPRGRGRQRVRLLRRAAVRQRPAALRPPAHRLRQGRRPALPDDARPPWRAPLRLGHPRAARRGRGRAPARDQATSPRSRRWASRRSTTPAGPACCATPTSGALRHPPGPLGRLRQRLQDARPGLHGERHVGVQDAVGQGPDLRGLPGALVLLALRDAAVCNTETKMDDVYRTGRTRRSRSAFELREPGPGAAAGLDDHAVDAAVEPGRSRWPPDVEYVLVVERRAARYVLAAARLGAYARELGDAPRARPLRGAELVGHRLPPAVRLLRRPARTRHRARRRLRHHRGRHRDRAHRAGVRRGGQGRHRRGGHRGRRAGGLARASSTPGRAAVRGHAGVRRQQPDHPARRLKAPAWVLRPRDLRPPVPALLALREPAHPAGGRLVVRRGHEVPGPDGRAEPADHLGARARQGRPVRQVAGGRARLVDLPQPVLGLADPGVGSATTRRTRAPTSTARWTSWSATSACGRPTCTGRRSTS